MKKNISKVLLALVLVSSMPVHAMQQLNQRWNRVQQCLTGQCTKWEALKAARDASAAIIAAMATMYGVKRLTSSFSGSQAVQEEPTETVRKFEEGDIVTSVNNPQEKLVVFGYAKNQPGVVVVRQIVDTPELQGKGQFAVTYSRIHQDNLTLAP